MLSTGADVGLQIGASDVTFTGPSGFTAKFTGTGPSYTAPSGINAKLVKNSDGTYSLTYNKTSEKLTFTSGGYLTKDADKNGNALTLYYNADNTLASIKDTAGRVTTFGYAGGFISSITDPAGREIDYSYTNGRLVRIQMVGVAAYTQFDYDASGRLSRIETPNVNYVDFGYDASNRVSTVTRYTLPQNQGDARTTTFAYPSSTTTTEQDPAGHTTTYTLDSSGRVTQVKNALGNTESKSWTANSDIASATDAMGSTPATGNKTTFSYDSNNNLTAVATPTGAGATAQYANSTSPACSSNDSTHPYLPKCVENAQGNQSSLTYDGPGNVTSQKDTSPGTNTGVTQSYAYQGDSGVPSCGGHNGQECSSTTGNGSKTTYAYDGDGNLTTVTPPAPGNPTTYGYDSLGRVTSVTTAHAGTTSYGYDLQDELLTVTVQGDSQPTLMYDYDWDGDRTSYERYNDRITVYGYDGMDRQTSTNSEEAYTQVTYDAAGNVASYLPDIQTTISYGYDAGNELTSLTEPGGSCTAPISGCTTFGYNHNGVRTTTSYPGGTTQTITVDNSSRTTEVKATHGSTVLSDVAYNYKIGSVDTGVVQTRTDKLGVGAPANSVTTYTYDTLVRLTKAVEKTSAGATNASWSYAYDKDGNRTSNSATISGTTTTTSQGYNAIDELTSLAGSSAGLSYDGDGNETANPGNVGIGVLVRTSETANRLEQLTSITAAGIAIPFDYDGQDNTDRFAAGTTSFVNDMLGLSAQTADGTTGQPGPTTLFIRTPDGTLVAETTGGTSQYFLSDKLGSIVGTVNATGTKTASYAYDPYGRTRTATGTNAAANPFRYTGGYYDSGTGLTKLGARYYDPNIGRFTQPDPSGKEGNPYAYAENNSINNTDPTGLFDFGSFFEGFLSGLDTLGGAALGTTLILTGFFGEGVTFGTSTLLIASGVTVLGGSAGVGYASYTNFKNAFSG